jgi:hypothetical protein
VHVAPTASLIRGGPVCQWVSVGSAACWREVADVEHRPRELGLGQDGLRNDFRSPPGSCPNYEGLS